MGWFSPLVSFTLTRKGIRAHPGGGGPARIIFFQGGRLDPPGGVLQEFPGTAPALIARLAAGHAAGQRGPVRPLLPPRGGRRPRPDHRAHPAPGGEGHPQTDALPGAGFGGAAGKGGGIALPVKRQHLSPGGGLIRTRHVSPQRKSAPRIWRKDAPD